MKNSVMRPFITTFQRQKYLFACKGKCGINVSKTLKYVRNGVLNGGNLMKSAGRSELNKLVFRTVEVYNRYRSPEATAKLLRLEKNSFTIEFEGAFCQSCGMQDYFEDFVYEFEGLSSDVKVEIQEIEQTSPRSFKVQYVVKGGFSGGKLDEEGLFEEFLRERGLSVEDYRVSNPCTKDVMRFHFRTWLFERKTEKKKHGI